MLPGLCKKTGYSLKDTFIMIIKCLVLTMAFLFVNLTSQNSLINAETIELKSGTPGLTLSLDQYNSGIYNEYSWTAKISSVETSSTGHKYAYLRFQITHTGWFNYVKANKISVGYWHSDASRINPHSDFSWSWATYDDGSRYKSVTTKDKTDNYYKNPGKVGHIAIVFVEGVTGLNALGCVSSGGQTLSQYGITSFDSTAETIFYMPYAWLRDSLRIMFYTTDSTDTASKLGYVLFENNLPPSVSSFSVSDGDTSNGTSPSGYTNSKKVNVSIGTISNVMGTAKYMIGRCDGQTSGDESCVTIYSESSTKPSTVTMDSSLATGYNTFILIVKDSSSGKEAKKYAYIYYDATAPTLSVSCSPSCGWEDGAITVGFSVYESHSGIDHYEYSTTSSSSGFVSIGTGTVRKYTGNQNLTYWYRAVDKAGNVSNVVSKTIRIDINDPTISSFSVSDGDSSNGTGLSGYTNSTKVNISQSSSDSGGSGKYYYSMYDGSSEIYSSYTAPTSVTLATTTNGTHTLKLYVYDAAWNLVYKTTSITLDTAAPTATVACSGGGCGGWTNQNVTVTVSGSDTGGSGIRGYGVGSAYTIGSTRQWTYSTEQNTTYYYKVFDNAGNSSSAVGASIKIDRTAPTGTLVITNDSNSAWVNRNVIVKLSGLSDAGSGLAKYQYSYDQSVWNDDWDTDSTISLTKGTWSAERNNTVYFRACDKLGNCTGVLSQTTQVKIDKTSPSGGSVVCSGTCDAWTKNNVTVSGSGGSDALSGGIYYMYQIGSGSWTTGNSYMFGTDINTTITYRLYDAAGNYRVVGTKTVKIDKTAPNVGTFNLINSSNGQWTKELVEVVLSGLSDSGSGLAKYEYSYDKSSWNDDWSSKSEAGYPSKTTGRWSSDRNATVYFRVCDNLGNCTGVLGSTPIKIDTQAPSATIKCTPACGTWTNQNVTVTLANPSGGASGIKEYMMATSSTANYSSNATSNTWTFTTNINATYYFRIYDGAGNFATYTAVLKIDKTAPTISAFSGSDGDSSNGTGDAGYTNSTKVSVTQTSTDSGGSGKYYYQVYDGSSQIYAKSTTIPTNVTLANTTNGVHTLKLYVYDLAGNVSAAKELRITFDNVKPSISAFSAADDDSSNGTGDAGYTNSKKIKHSQTSSDATSGIKQYLIQDGSSTIYGASTANPKGVSDELANTTNGSHRLTLYVYDRAGNVQSRTYDIIFDNVSPTITGFSAADDDSGNGTGNAGFTNSTRIKHNQTSTDATSGIKQYLIQDGSSTIYGASAINPSGVSDELANTTNGSHRLTLYVYDRAGNVQSRTYDILFDNVKPTISAFSITGNESAEIGFTNTRNVKVSQTSTDSLSGVYRYTIKDGSTSIYNHTVVPSSTTLANATNGSHTLSLYVYDNAGNEQVRTAAITFDNIAPVIQFSGLSTTISKNIGSKIQPVVTETNKKANASSEMMKYCISVNGATSDCTSYTVFDVKQSEYIKVMKSKAYYIYLMIANNKNLATDKAGNTAGNDGTIVFNGDRYLFKKIKITPTSTTESGYKTPMQILTEDGKNFVANQPTTNLIQIQGNEYVIITVNNYNTQKNVNAVTELNYIGLFPLQSLTNTTSSKIYENVLVKLSSDHNFEIVSNVFVIMAAPILVADTIKAATQVVEKGEELSNIGLSFKGKDGASVEHEQIITLNGVRVKRVDTNQVGVYTIVDKAMDTLGRKTVIERRIIVEDTKIELPTQVEIIKEEMVSIPVVKVIESLQEKVENETKVEIETNKVELRLEKGVKVKGYKKKKEIKKVRKENFTFKLFSKYFFKIYDG